MTADKSTIWEIHINSNKNSVLSLVSGKGYKDRNRLGSIGM